MLMVNKDVQK